jgi:hypothetical protein
MEATMPTKTKAGRIAATRRAWAKRKRRAAGKKAAETRKSSSVAKKPVRTRRAKAATSATTRSNASVANAKRPFTMELALANPEFASVRRLEVLRRKELRLGGGDSGDSRIAVIDIELAKARRALARARDTVDVGKQAKARDHDRQQRERALEAARRVQAAKDRGFK